MPETWPCDLLPTSAPQIGDELSSPTTESMLPQVLLTAPRGPAWGTDEAGDGRGAGPEQLRMWTGVAAWIADLHGWAWQLALQFFPSSLSYSIADWEEEFGLPDPCANPPGSLDARKAAVRARMAGTGGASPAYFICVARAAGYDIAIEEPSAFECAGSELGDGGAELTAVDPESTWIVRPVGYRMFEFEAGAGGGELGDGGTRLVSYTDITGLECSLRRISPVHTQLIIATS